MFYEEATRVFGTLHTQPRSLIADLHLLRLATLRGVVDLLKHAEEIIEHLLDPTESRPRFDCFKAVLNLVDSEFTRWPPKRKLPVKLRLACIWYHASRVHGFLRNAVDLPHVTAWLRQNTSVWTEDVLVRDPVFWNDIARPNNVTHGSVILHGIAHLLGDQSSEAIQMCASSKLKSLLEQVQEETFLTRVDLARRTDLLGNTLGSFLGRASVEEGTTVFGQELAGLFALPSDDEIAARLEDLAREPHEWTYWAMLYSVIGDGKMPEPLYSRMLELLRSISFDGLARSNPKILGPALTFACHHVRASSDEQLVSRMEQVVMGFARLAATAPDDDTLPLWLALSNALLVLAIVPGNEDQSARRFFDMFRRFTELCPPLAKRISTGSINWTKRLPFAQQVNLWPFIFTTRAIQ